MTLLKEGESPASPRYDVTLDWVQIREFESASVTRVTAHNAFDLDWSTCDRN